MEQQFVIHGFKVYQRLHANNLMASDNHTKDLNDQADVVGIVSRGGYEAADYRDFTGDGWIQATCPQLSREIPVSLAAS